MAELTKERIEQYIKNPLEHGLTRSEQMEMACQLLAGLGQEPVAWMTTRDGDGTFPRLHLEEAAADCWVNTCNVAPPIAKHPLYAAPQLPQPAVVPSAVKGELAFIDHFESIIGERDGDIDIGQLGVGNYDALMLAALDAFRASMLQGAEPVSQPYTLPDGMVVVPVEPTREMRLQIHPIAEATCKDCGRSVTADCEDNVLLSWADMIAAAPQQEVVTDNTTQQFESLGLIVTSDERKMEIPYCSKHPETELLIHPFEQLLSYPPQPAMYCPLCKPSVTEWSKRHKQLRSRR